MKAEPTLAHQAILHRLFGQEAAEAQGQTDDQGQLDQAVTGGQQRSGPEAALHALPDGHGGEGAGHESAGETHAERGDEDGC